MRYFVVIAVVFASCAPAFAGEGAAAGKGLRVPLGCKAAEGTVAEPYNKKGFAKEVVHEKTGIALLFVPSGEFEMGTPADETDRGRDEGPLHTVTITKPFYLGKYEVTQSEWAKLVGKNPSGFKDDDHPVYKGKRKYTLPPEVTDATRDERPVEQVSWNDCAKFLEKAGAGLRLPTEVEWEYACRAGTTTPFNCGETLSVDRVNFNGKPRQWDRGTHEVSRGSTIPVGVLPPNAWGLFDMHGNVYEFCSDRYEPGYYSKSPSSDPKGPESGRLVVVRGGCWNSYAAACRSGKRYYFSPADVNFGLGLRVALDVGAGEAASANEGPVTP